MAAITWHIGWHLLPLVLLIVMLCAGLLVPAMRWSR